MTAAEGVYPKSNKDPIYASEGNNDYYGRSPVDSVTSWLKTGVSVSTGTADTNTLDKLVDSTATFIADGVRVGTVIHNTTDDTFGIVGTVESETSIVIVADTQAGSAVTDVFPLGTESYVVYDTMKLNSNWYECNGQTISDSESAWDGKTLPDMNNATQAFMRGANSSGATGGSETHTHGLGTLGMGTNTNSSAPLMTVGSAQGLTHWHNMSGLPATTDTKPTFYEVVKIIRIK